MPPLPPGSRFPDRPLRDLSGGTRRPSDSWREGPALVAVGHGDCATTRLVLPYVDRIHARRGRASVLLILQEDPRSGGDLVAELGLSVPACLDEDPYPLSSDLGLGTVPTLFLVAHDGVVSRVVEGFSRRDLEDLARELGVRGTLFAPDDDAPAFRPG